ncbi:MAG: DUF4411 family protein [Bacteroidales bacterium]|nr:DUF4411 family protein [Bacteroidales bacterium]
MVAFDASSMIHAWDNYPIENFPPLWGWLASEIVSRKIVISQIAYEEVDRKMPDCGRWLRDNAIQRIQISNDILAEASQIKRLLGIIDDNYHPKGVGENDILIISTSKVHNLKLITEEPLQFDLPGNMSKYKIPAVCGLPELHVDCIKFINFIKESGEVFS